MARKPRPPPPPKERSIGLLVYLFERYIAAHAPHVSLADLPISLDDYRRIEPIVEAIAVADMAKLALRYTHKKPPTKTMLKLFDDYWANTLAIREQRDKMRADNRTLSERIQARMDQLDPYTRTVFERQWRRDAVRPVPANDKED